jgi:type VI secretion system protein ImpB
MKAIKPRVAFMVPNTMTGQGNVAVDITFESMDDFSPGAIAKKVDSLAKLLEARTQLSNLLTYMDGKTGAEELIGKVLADPALLKTLAAQPASASDAPAKEE